MFCGISNSATPCGGAIASRNAERRSNSIVVQSVTRLVNLAKLSHDLGAVGLLERAEMILGVRMLSRDADHGAAGQSPRRTVR